MSHQYTLIPSPIGTLCAVFNDGVLYRLSRQSDWDVTRRIDAQTTQLERDAPVRADIELHDFSQQIVKIFTENQRYSAPIRLSGLSAFQQLILNITAQIPAGQVRSYGYIAKAAGHPGASRAVGTALAKNPLPWVIPCHRVIHADGKLGAYSAGGTPIKAHLLATEGVQIGQKNTIYFVNKPFESAL